MGENMLATAHFTETAAPGLEVVAHFVQFLDGGLLDDTDVLTAAVVTIAAFACCVIIAFLVDLFARSVRVTDHTRLADTLLSFFAWGRIGFVGVVGILGALATLLDKVGLLDVAVVNAAAVVSKTAPAFEVVVANLIDLDNGGIRVARFAIASALRTVLTILRLLLFARLASLLDALAGFVKARVDRAMQKAASVAESALARVPQVEAQTARRGHYGFARGVGVFAILTELAFSGVAKGAADVFRIG